MFDPTKIYGISPKKQRLSEAIVDCLLKATNDRVKVGFSFEPEWNMIQMTVEKNAHRRNLALDVPMLKYLGSQNMDEYMATLFLDAINDIDKYIAKEGENNDKRRSNPEDDQ